jgi:hypothetical protein
MATQLFSFERKESPSHEEENPMASSFSLLHRQKKKLQIIFLREDSSSKNNP